MRKGRKGKKNRQRQIRVPKAIKAENTGMAWADESEEANGERAS